MAMIVETAKYVAGYAVHVAKCTWHGLKYTAKRAFEPSTWGAVAAAYGSLQVLPGFLKWVGVAVSIAPMLTPGFKPEVQDNGCGSA